MKAHHPGSAKIEEFLGQLEVLWDELKKQHQRNVVVLQASEELNFRVSPSFTLIRLVISASVLASHVVAI